MNPDMQTDVRAAIPLVRTEMKKSPGIASIRCFLDRSLKTALHQFSHPSKDSIYFLWACAASGNREAPKYFMSGKVSLCLNFTTSFKVWDVAVGHVPERSSHKVWTLPKFGSTQIPVFTSVSSLASAGNVCASNLEKKMKSIAHRCLASSQ